MTTSDKSPLETYTANDYFRIVPMGAKADLIGGKIVPAQLDTPAENELTAFVATLIRFYDARRDIGGDLFLHRFSFVLSATCVAEPDIAYVRSERSHLISETCMTGPPDIAVEIVSHDSVDRDYEFKREMYEAAGVPEYWIIDPLDASAEFLVLQDGKYQPAALEEGVRFRSTVLPGFWLDARWLFAAPLPKEPDCLRQILAG
jgi:Uma2 family endonuclease